MEHYRSLMGARKRRKTATFRLCNHKIYLFKPKKEVVYPKQNHTFVFIALITFSASLNTLRIHELHEFTQRGCFAALLCITFVLIRVIRGCSLH